jgi:hypothetical protein
VDEKSVSLVSFSILFFPLHIPSDACALTSIVPPLSLIDMIHCTPYTKATPASVQDVGVDF